MATEFVSNQNRGMERVFSCSGSKNEEYLCAFIYNFDDDIMCVLVCATHGAYGPVQK